MRIMYDSSKGSNNLITKSYFNSDQTSDYVTKNLTSGFIFILNNSLVSQYLKKQTIIANLSIEVKYIVIIFAIKEAT